MREATAAELLLTRLRISVRDSPIATARRETPDRIGESSPPRQAVARLPCTNGAAFLPLSWIYAVCRPVVNAASWHHQPTRAICVDVWRIYR